MTTGTIKTLVPERGFGFIGGDDGKEDFFHRSAVAGYGVGDLLEGQLVELEPEAAAPKGPRARLGRRAAPAATAAPGGGVA